MKSKPKKSKVVVVVGPTASGKSDLALRLAKLAQGKPFKKMGILGAEIISADSRQVYRGMDIGAGKVKRDRQQTTDNKQREEYYSGGVRHWMLDVADPKRTFAVNQYQRLARRAVEDITRRGKLPIVTGGTGFYIDALIYDLALPQVTPDKKLRARFDKLTAEKLFEKLRRLDPARAKTIDRHNKRRLVRALEIVLTTGSPVPALPKSYQLKAISYDVLWLGVTWPRDVLARRIKRRLDARFKPDFAKATTGKQGMLAEVKNIRRSGVSWKRLESFGLEYRHLARYLQGKYEVKMSNDKVKKGSKFNIRTSSFRTMREALHRDIVRYSKRQMTWFKRNKNIHWVKNRREAEKLTSQFLL